MNINRRVFLRRGLLTAGAAAVAGTAGTAAVKALTQPVEAAPVVPAPAGPTTPVLTPDHKLVHVCCTVTGGKSGHSLPVLNNAEARKGIPGRKWVMVIDLSKCDGCQKCTETCGKAHFIPPDRQWIKVFKMQESAHTAPYWFPKPCFHCDNPPCTRVCPVDATFKRQDGIVLIDNERCIGCRFCMAACPYSTRFFNWGKPDALPDAGKPAYSPETGFPRRMGTVEKCDFCPDMAANGELPHCITACAMGALYYGDQNEDAVTNARGETERLSKLLADRAGYRYMEELGTEPRVYYLPPKNRIYPGPDVADVEPKG